MRTLGLTENTFFLLGFNLGASLRIYGKETPLWKKKSERKIEKINNLRWDIKLIRLINPKKVSIKTEILPLEKLQC